MNFSILIRCFLIGVLASSSLGPIFVLTFNRGAIYGFLRGFATAFGACIADGVYFFLGLVGVLAILKESEKFMFFLDTIGGILLILLGIYSLRKARQGFVTIKMEGKISVFLTAGKSFLITILNPLVFLFFMIIGVQILPEGIQSLTLRQVFFGSFVVALGSLSVLCMVSLIASFVGNCISKAKLRFISFITGLVFIGVGIYLLDHLFMSLIQILR
ncbi:LysE family transporter [Candidatus Babeliales bacterium]|nr:LysE family transporter [Candidatus Babeliales bacterium]